MKVTCVWGKMGVKSVSFHELWAETPGVNSIYSLVIADELTIYLSKKTARRIAVEILNTLDSKTERL